MKIRALSIAVLAASLLTGLTAATLTWAADKPASADGPATPKKVVQDAPKTIKIDGPLSKLELTDAQKTAIGQLRTDLRAEVKVLTDEEKAKEVALLTPEQQAQLAALDAAAKKAADDKKAAAAAAAATQKSTKDAPKTPKTGAAPDSKLP